MLALRRAATALTPRWSRALAAARASSDEAGHFIRIEPQRVVVLHPYDKRQGGSSGASSPSLAREAARRRLDEACSLARTLTCDIVQAMTIPRDEPMRGGPTRSRGFASSLGTGRVESIAAVCAETDTPLVFVDSQLSPGQTRGLRDAIQSALRAMPAVSSGQDPARLADELTVVDRTGVILAIFARHARTHEARVQVELATLAHRRSNLVADAVDRPKQSLAQQRSSGSAGGFIGGYGEKKLELDRRALDKRELLLRKQLEQAERTRELHRERRRDQQDLVVALVGYTNAGKSALAAAMTHDNEAFVAENKLFATLDTTVRGLTLPSGLRVLVVDTVGMISDLPHSLIASFRATLGDVVNADILLHVRDPTSPTFEEDAQVVRRVVGSVIRQHTTKRRGDDDADADKDRAASDAEASLLEGRPTIEVWTKCDLLDEPQHHHRHLSAAPSSEEDETVAPSALRQPPASARLQSTASPTPPPRPESPAVVLTSAVRGDGLHDLVQAIDARAKQLSSRKVVSLTLGPSDEHQSAQEWLFSGSDPGVRVTHTVPVDESDPSRGMVCTVLMSEASQARFQAAFPRLAVS